MKTEKHKTPVILDTDIGSDIDDTWALAMMLKSPELDVRLIVSDTGDTIYRARIIARMLEIAGRADIPVGVGVPFEMQGGFPQSAWVEGYALEDYSGTVYHDGVGAIIETIMKSPVPVTLICIGPVSNIAEALRREPRIARKAKFVGMHGSVRKGLEGAPQISKEWNVACDIPACQQVFSAAWDMTITPLDTCGLVVLQGDQYNAVRHSDDPLIKAVMENYRIWLNAIRHPPENFERKSSVLFDTVAIYLAFAAGFLVVEDMGIRVSDDGYTLIDDKAKRVHVATEWKDLAGFENFLTQRLTTGGTPAPL